LPLRVIFNPGAGSGRAGRIRADLGSAFIDRGVDVEFVDTKAPGHARELARQAALDRVDGVVVVGGDGTLFEVVNGLAELPAGQRPPLGVVPLGTGNAFARDLGLAPWQWQDAVAQICAGRTSSVDIARATFAAGTFHFINVIGCGFVVSAGRMAQHAKWLGKSAYQAGVLLALPRLRPLAFVIDVDGVRHEQEACLVTISNSRFTGTDFQIAPDAKFDDGLLDILVVRSVTRRRLLQVLPSVRHGGHLGEPEVTVLRGRSIVLHEPAGLELAPDGEFLGDLPATIECQQGALSLYVGSLDP
jgi:diacylglycerol kinase (ATP)